MSCDRACTQAQVQCTETLIGQIKPKAVWPLRKFSLKANKTNSFVWFLGESTVRQSALGFI